MSGEGRPFELKPRVERIERETIREALEAAGGHRRKASWLLGISLRTLQYKLVRLGMLTS